MAKDHTYNKKGNYLSPSRNMGHGMCYPVCPMVHIKDPLLLIGNSSPYNSGSWVTLLLCEWPFTVFQRHITMG